MFKQLILGSLLAGPLLATAAAPITPDSAPIVIYQSDEPYDDIKSNLEMAITDRGMLITNTLHIQSMLDRTAADTGLTRKIYSQAESLEFCNITITYKMGLADPANMANCPLTVSVYQKVGDSRTYLAYRRPALLGEAAEAERALLELLDGIVQESLE